MINDRHITFWRMAPWGGFGHYVSLNLASRFLGDRVTMSSSWVQDSFHLSHKSLYIARYPRVWSALAERCTQQCYKNVCRTTFKKVNPWLDAILPQRR